MSFYLPNIDKPEIQLKNPAVSFRKGGGSRGGGGGSGVSLDPYQIAAVVWCVAWALLGLVAISRVCSRHYRSWVLAFPILTAFFFVIGFASGAARFRHSYVFTILGTMLAYMTLLSVALDAGRHSARVAGREGRGKILIIAAGVGYFFMVLYALLTAPNHLLTSHTFTRVDSWNYDATVNPGWAASVIFQTLFQLGTIIISFVIWGMGLGYRGMSKIHRTVFPIAGVLLFISWIADMVSTGAAVAFNESILEIKVGNAIFYAWTILFMFLSMAAIVGFWRPNTEAANTNAPLSPSNVPYKIDTNGSFNGSTSTPGPQQQQQQLMYQPQMAYMQQPGQPGMQPQMAYMQPGQPGQMGQPMMMQGQPMGQPSQQYGQQYGQPMMMQPQQFQQYPQQYTYVLQPGQQSPQLQPQLQPQQSPPLAHSPAPHQKLP